ncbi:MAG: serine protease, partial [Rhizobiaceae bacterium]
IHPGYAAFQQQVPSVLGVKYDEEFKVSTRPGAYDVALLELEDAVPSDTVLPLASPERIEALSPGDPVAFAGYLLRRTEGAAQQHLDPVPQVHFGHVSAVTDFFMFAASPANAQLIHNSIPITGGASGSPIINAQGDVVAIVSSGNVVPVGDAKPGESNLVPSAALVNYAQRADLIRQLLGEGPAFDMASASAQWSQAAGRFSEHRQYVESTALDLATRKLGVRMGAPRPQNGFLAKGYSYQLFSHSLEAGKSYVALVYSDKPEALQLNVRGVAGCEAASRWPTLFVRVGKDVSAEFVVFGSAKFDRDFSFILYEAPDSADSADPSTPAISCID